MDVVNLAEEFGRFTDRWSPKIVGDVNDMHVKVVKVGPGELIIVPRGVEHCPKTLSDEVHVVLLEPKGTLTTGNATNTRTVVELDRL